MHGFRIYFVALIVLAVTHLRAAEVRAISWETDHAAPAATLGQEKEELFSMIRLGVSTLPESEIMKLTFLGGSALGLPPEMAKSLHSLVTQRYEEISSDEFFPEVPSALPHCYSPKQPSHGFATLYVPDHSGADTKVIVFLHGFGGSFRFYLHFLAKTFPDHLILCPAYGINTSAISGDYLAECLEAASGDLGFSLRKPLLMGLSAGGFGGFREYGKNHRAYRGFICLAAYPPGDTIFLVPAESRIRLVAGAKESFVIDGTLRKAEKEIERRVVDYQSRLIPDQDHFFLLGDEETTRRLLRKWDSELRGDQLRH